MRFYPKYIEHSMTSDWHKVLVLLCFFLKACVDKTELLFVSYWQGQIQPCFKDPCYED